MQRRLVVLDLCLLHHTILTAFEVFGKAKKNTKDDAERLERRLTKSTLPFNLYPEQLFQRKPMLCVTMKHGTVLR